MRSPKNAASFVRMFKPQFAPMVQAGTKLQTVRPTPKRMPKSGDKISLRAWSDKPYRSKQRILREAIITSVDTFSIDTFPTMRINDIGLKYRSACDEFARADGFENYPALLEWFRATHGLPFEGIVIHWATPGQAVMNQCGWRGMAGGTGCIRPPGHEGGHGFSDGSGFRSANAP